MLDSNKSKTEESVLLREFHPRAEKCDWESQDLVSGRRQLNDEHLICEQKRKEKCKSRIEFVVSDEVEI